MTPARILQLDPATRESRRRAADAALTRASAERYEATLGEELERAIATELQIDEPDLRAFNAAKQEENAEHLFRLSEGFGPTGEDPDLYRDSEPHGSPLLILIVALALWAGIILGLLEAYDWAKGAF